MKSSRPFSSVQGLSEVAVLLHVSPQEINHLLSTIDRQYKRRSRRKADGSERRLYVPSDSLKLVQKKINEHVLSKIPLLPCVKGGVRHSSVFDNAAAHCGTEVVFTMDLEHCFPSIGPERVKAIYQAIGFGPEATRILTKLTTYRTELPQGVPTSTALANLALYRVDARISGLQREHRFVYTRWVDDLTFSGSSRVLKLRQLFRRIVESEGFKIKEPKTKTMFAHEPQIVTNLIVNRKVNLSRTDRAAIKKQVMQGVSRFHAFPAALAGKVYWLRSVNQEIGERLLQRVKQHLNGHNRKPGTVAVASPTS